MRRLLFLFSILLTACSSSPKILVQAVTPVSATPRPTAIPLLMATPTLIPTATPNLAIIRETLQTQTDAVLTHYPADWHILVEQVDGSVLYSRQTTERIDVASVIKIPIALLFFKFLEQKNIPSLKDYLAQKGTVGRTFEELLRAMLVNSEEDATFSLLTYVTNSRLDVKRTLRDWGAAHTDIYLRKSTVDDMTTLVDGLYTRNLVTPDAREIILTYMAEYTEADETRIGVIRAKLPCGGKFYDKRGTITQEYLVVADVAILKFPTPAGEKAYMIALFAYPGDSGATYESLVQGMETLAPVFWQDIQAENSLTEADECSDHRLTP
jgi:beta-lactamase class A